MYLGRGSYQVLGCLTCQGELMGGGKERRQAQEASKFIEIQNWLDDIKALNNFGPKYIELYNRIVQGVNFLKRNNGTYNNSGVNTEHPEWTAIIENVFYHAKLQGQILFKNQVQRFEKHNRSILSSDNPAAINKVLKDMLTYQGYVEARMPPSVKEVGAIYTIGTRILNNFINELRTRLKTVSQEVEKQRQQQLDIAQTQAEVQKQQMALIQQAKARAAAGAANTGGGPPPEKEEGLSIIPIAIAGGAALVGILALKG